MFDSNVFHLINKENKIIIEEKEERKKEKRKIDMNR
jgi:hypothetical protein